MKSLTSSLTSSITPSICRITKLIAFTSILTLSNSALSDEPSTIIDNFNHESNTQLATPRILMTDTTAGGQTSAQLLVSNGVIQIKGDILPPRGQPGWSSLVLPLAGMGEVYDASQFQGIKLLIKVTKGNVSISANSAEVNNYDYHSAQVTAKVDGKFHQVKIPFESMKRMWSEQTKLNTTMLNSLSIVAFSPQKAVFDFEIEEVAFY